MVHYALQKSCDAPFSFLACYILTSRFSGWGEETCVLFIPNTQALQAFVMSSVMKKKIKNKDMLNKDSWQQGLGVKMHFARMSLSVPPFPLQNTQERIELLLFLYDPFHSFCQGASL